MNMNKLIYIDSYRDTFPISFIPMEEGFSVGHPNPFLSLTNSSNNMDLFSNLQASMEGFNHGIMPFSNVGFPHQHPVALGGEASRLAGPAVPFINPAAHFFPPDMMAPLDEHEIHGRSSPSSLGTGARKAVKKNTQPQSYSEKKRKRDCGSGRVREETREVVHVRAKRGQATDSHSLAERLRREKINEKLRCLQDLVPGCYKTMGMAVMLDVIINYVRSLQNQIDFLSMKLSAASLFYDFNSSEAEAIETIQGNAAYQEMDKFVGEGYGGIPQFQTPNCPF